MKIVQALSAAWLAVKATYSATTLHLSEWWAGVVTSWGQASYEALARRAYANPTAARGLRLISQLMASVPFAVEVGDEMVTDHEMLRLVERPNGRTSRGRLFDQIVAHLYCGGELFFHRIAPDSGPNAGRPTATGGSLRLLSPGRFQAFVRDRVTDEVAAYRFGDGRGNTLTIPADEILHVRVYNPLDEDRGLPLLLGAHRALEQVEAADAWNKSIASGGGRVPGYFSPQLDGGHQLTPEQVAEAQEIADRATLERRARHLPQVLSGAFKYESAAMTLRDADFLKAGQENSRKIAAVIGLSPTLLGDEKGGSLTDAGVDSEVRAAYLLTILPLLDYVLGELNAWLSPAYGGARLTYDRDQIEALQEDVNAIYRRYVEAVGGPFLSVDEAREATGYDALGGDFATVRGSRPAPDPTPEEPPAPMRALPTGAVLDLDGVRAALRARYAEAA